MTEISIIILAKNEESYIGETLRAVLGQDTDNSFEVIVIDSGSRDKTVEIIKEYPVQLIQIKPQEFGHGRTRHLGARLSNGKYIVFLNGHAMPVSKFWLRNLIKALLVNERIAASYSRALPRPDCNPLGKRDILSDSYLFGERVKSINSLDEYKRFNPEEVRKLISFYTISCAIKKDILSAYPFSDIEFGEDIEWSKRILEQGFSIVFEPASEVFHSHNLNYSFIKIIKRYFDDTRANQRLLKRWDFISLLKLPAVFCLKSVKDIGYILGLEAGSWYKIKWILISPFMRSAEFLGTLFGVFPYIPPRFVRKLSLVEEMKLQ